MWVLGISCYYHDSAPALINDNEITFAIHEERWPSEARPAIARFGNRTSMNAKPEYPRWPTRLSTCAASLWSRARPMRWTFFLRDRYARFGRLS